MDTFSLPFGIAFWHEDGRTTRVHRHGPNARERVIGGAVRIQVDRGTAYIEIYDKSRIRGAIDAIHNIKNGQYDISADVVHPEDARQMYKPLEIKHIALDIINIRRYDTFDDVEELELVESKELNVEDKLTEALDPSSMDNIKVDYGTSLLQALTKDHGFNFTITASNTYGTNGKAILVQEGNTWSVHHNNGVKKFMDPRHVLNYIRSL
jgi:hypothetical protein